MTAPELKPCPFCGGAAIYVVAFGVHCTACTARVACTYDDCNAAWNTRTASIPAPGADYVAGLDAEQTILTAGCVYVTTSKNGDYVSAVPEEGAVMFVRAALSARPTTETRVVTVAQLRKWAVTVKTYTQDYTQDYTIDELGDDLFTLGEIRAILGDQASKQPQHGGATGGGTGC